MKESKRPDKSRFGESILQNSEIKGSSHFSTGMNVRSEAKLAELTVVEPLKLMRKNYSEIISKRAEEKRKMLGSTQKSSRIDDFNVEILKMKMSSVDGGDRAQNIPQPFRSQKLKYLHQQALKKVSRFPRERQKHTLSQIKLSPIPNIFNP